MKRKGILSALLALTVGLWSQIPAQAETLDLLHSVPLEISQYDIAQTLPQQLATADQVMNVLNATDNLLVRMEVMRRAHKDLPLSEQDKLLTELHARHRAQQNDAHKFFDHGYAQLVLKDNKSGLFFLRKANDRLQNQFSALAYAMAQAEVDLNQEGSTPEEMTTRKLDVRYLLRDAVNRDAANHMAGFWPSYVRVLEKLQPLPTYNNFATSDLSLTYLPYGNSVIPMRGGKVSYIPITDSTEVLVANAKHTACDPDSVSPLSAGDQNFDPAGEKPVSSRTVDFNGQNALVEFFKSTEETGKYRVRVLSQDGFPLLSFSSYRLSSVVEDLEGDGSYEIVIRQFEHDPYQPIIVYRPTPCGFELDRTVYTYFNK